MSPDDERLIDDLYNRAVLRVYGEWATKHTTWMPVRERLLARQRVERARAHLDALAVDDQPGQGFHNAPPDGPVHWNTPE